MKTVNCFNDLRPYGIEILTGEACGLGLRVLCDYTRRGKALIAKTYGLLSNFTDNDSWNSGPKDDPHVGSIMLTNNEVMTLGIFALLENGCDEVYTVKPVTSLKECLRIIHQVKRLLDEGESALIANADKLREAIKYSGLCIGFNDAHTVYGFERGKDTPDYRKSVLESIVHDGWWARRFAYRGTAEGGDRNRHEMSGRVH